MLWGRVQELAVMVRVSVSHNILQLCIKARLGVTAPFTSEMAYQQNMANICKSMTNNYVYKLYIRPFY